MTYLMLLLLAQQPEEYLKKEYPALMEAKEEWKKLSVTKSSDELLKKLAPDVTFYFAQVGNAYPVARPPIARIVLAVGKDVTELRAAMGGVEGKEAADPKDVVAFLNKFLPEKTDKAERAAAASRLYPACWHFNFGKGELGPDAFDVQGATARLKQGPDVYVVEFDEKDMIKRLEVKDNRPHPRCYEHLAAAKAFLRETHPEWSIDAVIYTDLTARVLPDHYLYDVLDGSRVVGFVLVRKNVKTCEFIDRATLKGLPAELMPLLR
jgi:hypothetical protein